MTSEDVFNAPTDDQKDRLEDFLSELMLLTRKYRILLMDDSETLEIIDMPSGDVIGMGLTCFTAPENDSVVRGYVPVDSILDGAWPVDTPDGPAEQHRVQNVYPRREP